MIHLEAKCGRCGETFIPAEEDDLVHIVRDDGVECGGTGEIVGEWVFTGTPSTARALHPSNYDR